MTEPRTRTAAEVADHASIIVDEAQFFLDKRRPWVSSDPATLAQTRELANLVNRLAAQVEDLAAVVAEHAAKHPFTAPEPAPFPPVEWPLTFTCKVVHEDTLTVEHSEAATNLYFTITHERKESDVVLTPNDARLLAHAILDRLGDSE